MEEKMEAGSNFNLEICWVGPKAMPDIWEDCKIHLARPLQMSRWGLTLEDVEKGLYEHTFQLWIILNGTEIIASLVTEVVRYSTYSALRSVALGGGEMELWNKALDRVLVDFALDHGCSTIEIIGRKGWRKYAAEFEYQEKYVTFEKVIHKNLH